MTRRALWIAVGGVCLAGCKQPLPPKIAVTIENDLGATKICDIYIRQSKHAAAGWGTDWLDRQEVLQQGTLRSFQLDPDVTWDLRLVACSGVEVGVLSDLTWRSATTVKASAATSAALDRRPFGCAPASATTAPCSER